MRVSLDEIVLTLRDLFVKYGLDEADAMLCARVHAQSSADGIYSHGLNRVPRFIEFIEAGYIKVKGKPSLVKAFGSLEVYNGNLGVGISNAMFASERAMQLAREHGIGLVGLNNTTHWMRGGTYGLEVANQGYVGIMWTNTESIMPPWGGVDAKLGNNPFVMAVPSVKGPVLLDMAMSQFSYGKLETLELAGEMLPIDGGYDVESKLTKDPGAILESMRILPTGYWKGSSMAFMLDIVSALVSGGHTTVDVDNLDVKGNGGYSQVFLVIDPNVMNSEDELVGKVERAIAHLKASSVSEGFSEVRYPGEGVLKRRLESNEKGVYVDERIWDRIVSLLEA